MTEPSPENPQLENRRPIKSRASGWAQASARGLAKAGASPNMISGASVAFAALGGALMALAGMSGHILHGVALVAAAACIQARLICNLLDGMVAVEFKRGSASGPIWNELPDRVSDAFFLAGAGACAYGSAFPLTGLSLGWTAAVLAVTTAYVRELGRGLGLQADFSGPMAKPQRMAALTATCVIAAFEPFWGGHGEIMLAGLAVIVAGTALTVARRTRSLARGLAERGRSPSGT
ncbi:CDP-alcohol phosphatidyltransferase family protein [Phenylobacterium sp.]|uniref:CDP-alcohol phosphatidyltransferase family protein n=1 Tax=Phenylobacterium sp. TaxID=1871053 RepID=UPI00122B78E9|nr:CDP-alcohol phosphatidyltransferase family protein [Phenylobacterium sp.]THD53587.1 MAG: CDP-alcohol phosphatidyltransferase family protein [Phenylobacterium sp.]